MLVGSGGALDTVHGRDQVAKEGDLCAPAEAPHVELCRRWCLQPREWRVISVNQLTFLAW